MQSVHVMDVDGIRQKGERGFELEVVVPGGSTRVFEFESAEASEVVAVFKRFQMKAAAGGES